MVTYAAGGDRRPDAHDSARARRGHADRDGAVRRAERRVPARAAARDGRAVVARRGRFADAAVGGRGAQIMSALVIVSTLGAMNGVILAGPRVYLAMARDGLLFRWAGAVHPRLPDAAPGDRAAGRLVVRARRDRHLPGALHARRLHRVDLLRAARGGAVRRCGGARLRAAVPGLGLSRCSRRCSSPSTAAIVVNQVVAQPVESAIGLLFVLLGLPVYYIWVGKPHPERARVRVVDVHNHYYPPQYIDALRSGESAVTVKTDADGNPELHYPGRLQHRGAGASRHRVPAGRARAGGRDARRSSRSRRRARTSRRPRAP